MTKFLQNPPRRQFAIELSGRARVGHFVAVRCPFSKIRVAREKDGQRDGRWSGMEGQHEAAERGRKGRFCSLSISAL